MSFPGEHEAKRRANSAAAIERRRQEVRVSSSGSEFYCSNRTTILGEFPKQRRVTFERASAERMARQNKVIEDMWNEGEPVSLISERLGITEASIINRRRALNLKPRRAMKKDATIEQLQSEALRSETLISYLKDTVSRQENEIAKLRARLTEYEECSAEGACGVRVETHVPKMVHDPALDEK